jgi:predicted  nucleic acid-binding Zn-ribbon protein
LVLTELRNLNSDIGGVKEGQVRIEGRLIKLEERQDRLEKKLDVVYDQTVKLTEFYADINMKLDNVIEDSKSIHEILGEHEVSIRTLRRKPV